MISWFRFLVALAIGIVTGLFFFAAAYLLIGHLGSCPPEIRTCDLPMMGGFGLGLIAGSVLGFGAGWASYRWLGRELGERPPRAT